MMFGYKRMTQSVLMICLFLSSLSVVASDYQILRLNGMVMPSVGTSKKITIEMAEVQEPLYVFIDYNYSKVFLSQRIALTSEQKSGDVTLMPGSDIIQISVIPQQSVHEYLDFMKKDNNYDNLQKTSGIELIAPVKDAGQQNMYHQQFKKLNESVKPIAIISYDKIEAGELVKLPNPFVKISKEVEVVEHSHDKSELLNNHDLEESLDDEVIQHLPLEDE